MGGMDSVIHALPRLRDCCFYCAGLRTGCQIIGWMHIILGMIAEPFVWGFMFLMDATRQQYKQEEWRDYGGSYWRSSNEDYYPSHAVPKETFPDNLKIRFRRVVALAEISQAVFLMMHISFTLLAVFLLIGVAQKSTKKIKVWLVTHIIMMIVMVVQTIIIVGLNLVTKVERDYQGRQALQALTYELIGFGIVYGLSIYSILVVKSFYVETEEAQKTGQDEEKKYYA